MTNFDDPKLRDGGLVYLCGVCYKLEAPVMNIADDFPQAPQGWIYTRRRARAGTLVWHCTACKVENAKRL